MASFRIQWLVCTWLLLENDTAHVLSHSLLQCWKPTKKFLFLPRGNFSVGFFKKRSWAFTSSHLVYTCTSYICTSYACTSCIFTSYVNTSHIFTSYSTSSHLASSHPMPAHPMPARLKASRLTASPLTSSHLTSAHLTSSRLTSSALTSSHLTSSLSLFLSVSFPLSLSLLSLLCSLFSVVWFLFSLKAGGGREGLRKSCLLHSFATFTRQKRFNRLNRQKLKKNCARGSVVKRRKNCAWYGDYAAAL